MAVNLEKYLGKGIYNTISFEEKVDLEIMFDPKKWAQDRLGWLSRDYQDEFFDSLLDAKQLVLRWGRRLGKTDCMCIASLFYADTQYNLDPDKGSYKVLIICPYESQIDAYFDRLKVIIENSPKLAGSVRMQHHKFTFANGSTIMGKTAGSKSNTGAASLRGQGADLIIFDEVDYMGDKEIMNVLQLKKEAPGRIRVIASSTPTGDRKLFYRWCTEAEDLGWTHIYRNSLVSKEIHDINPDNKAGLTYLEEIKQQLTEIEYLHEVMAEFGDNQRSLFHKRFIDAAVNAGKTIQWRYDNLGGEPPVKRGPRILGVDWDKSAASTNMLVIEFNKAEGRFYILQRVEIPSHEFTYTEAVSKIIFLNWRYNLDWCYIDRGYGETQIEMLKQYGIKNPDSGLRDKIVGVQFSQKIEIRDPHTKLKVKKDIKPFMVNNAVNVLEKELITFSPYDHKVIKQLEDYHIKKLATSGKPQYGEQNEHIVDCICLALLGFEQQYGALFNIAMSARVVGLNKPIDDETIHFDEAKDKPRVINLMGGSRPQERISYMGGNRRPSQTNYSRRNF